MENSKDNRTMTIEAMLSDPSFAHIHEGLRYLQKTDSKDIFPKKYEKSMIGLALTDAVNLFQKNPNIPLKKVVAKIIGSFDDDLRADLIMKMTKQIIEKWGKLSSALPTQTEPLSV